MNISKVDPILAVVSSILFNLFSVLEVTVLSPSKPLITEIVETLSKPDEETTPALLVVLQLETTVDEENEREFFICGIDREILH